jgi:hypothetical protein
MANDLDFKHARERLLLQFDNNPNAALRALKAPPLVAKATMYRLFNRSVPDNKFLNPVKTAIIDYIKPTITSRMYFRIMNATNAGNDELKKLDHYQGRYRYFRKTTAREIISGTLDIIKRDHIYLFYHANEDRLDDPFPLRDYDHEGFVFQLGQRIHLLGIGPRYIRPIIAHECLNLAKDALHGFVIATTEQSRGAQLFSARFVMYHESHAKYGAKRNDTGIALILKRSSTDTGILAL